jgi:hypothetical protein
MMILFLIKVQNLNISIQYIDLKQNYINLLNIKQFLKKIAKYIFDQKKLYINVFSSTNKSLKNSDIGKIFFKKISV